ncbi:hypothetical protein MUN89_00025 [Halobacillus salinarum]|uniref:Uncharacterized protein n=1 Tax=Halobacillus salinarum TaxID=2932257 RepID=A0ABY4EIV0_9BACI|nr:hypothetical protein [Halobacillus salinarum]UOQ44423.1 hypothetical protein MUN89_00025 [Halobacillus salinarum]
MIDKVLESYGRKLDSTKIRKAVGEVYEIDLKDVSDKREGKVTRAYPEEIMRGIRQSLHKEPSEETDHYIMTLTKLTAMDLYLNSIDTPMTPVKIRQMINHIFGINLEGISTLDEIRVSLYSKGQWITQGDTHLVVVSTGQGM